MVDMTSSTNIYSHFDPGPPPTDEQIMQDSDTVMTTEETAEERYDDFTAVYDPVNMVGEERIIIAIDFGTTFSSVAYVVLPKNVSPKSVTVNTVKCIGNYPDADYEPRPGLPNMRYDVPTELWYEDLRPKPRDNKRPGKARDSSNEEEQEGETESSDSESEASESEQSDSDANAVEMKSSAQSNISNLVVQHWGFGVQQKLNLENIPSDEALPLTRFKLFLDHKKVTQSIREDLKPIIEDLSKRRIIQNETDIYAHYLTNLLRHVKHQLLASKEFNKDMLVQFVLCVPAKWPNNACRIMQTALEKAVEEVEFSEKATQAVHDMFMISEPEAAAECILAEAESDLYRNETVVVLDAGGGTVDAVTYKCDNEQPLRLLSEIVEPNSELCGASYINIEFELKVRQKLAKAHYLARMGKTIRSIAQASTTYFENNHKRTFDSTDRKTADIIIKIDGLKPNSKKNFLENRLKLQRKTVKKFYKASLEGVERVLENQLDLAEGEGQAVQTIILTGGFGQSPSLQSHLRNYLEDRFEINSRKIELVIPQNPATAVARGAVLRAANKQFGPSRITQSSYGFLVSEPFRDYPEHEGKKPQISKADGERYINDTILWVIQTGDKVANMQEFSFPVKHTFPFARRKLICEEIIWMSDDRHTSHYRKTHAMNTGAEQVGSIIADLTFLRDQRLIEPQLPSSYSIQHRTKQQHWAVHYEVVMIVEGRSIRFEARWPAREDLKIDQVQKILAMKRVGIAASFKPGTA